MGDKVSIPRSYAGQIGTEDVTDAVKRSFLPIPLFHPGPTAAHDTTTGLMWGCESGTTGMPIFQRNVTVEKLYVSGWKNTTVNGKTTLIYARVMRGASTVATMVMRNSTTLAERWHAWSTAARLPNVTSTQSLHVLITTRNQMTLLSAALVVRQRADS